MITRIFGAAIAGMGYVMSFATANAGELRVFCSTALQSSIEALSDSYARKSGNRLVMSYDTTAMLKAKIEKGDHFDLAILTPATISDLSQQGKLADAPVTLAQAGAGLAVKAGSPRPDIATIEGFKSALLNARAIVYSTTGASGSVFARAIDKLGINDAVKAKGKAIPNGSTGEALVRGDGDLAVQLIPELMMVRGADFVGPFPAEVQSYVVMTGAVSADAADRGLAQEFIAFLQTPAAQTVIRAKGLEPR